MYTLIRKSIRILVLLTAVCLCFTSCDEDKKESSSAVETTAVTTTITTQSSNIISDTNRNDNNSGTEESSEGITVHCWYEDRKEQWDITDPEVLQRIDEWLVDFQNTHKASKEPVGESDEKDQYSFRWHSQMVKLGYYDKTAIIIGHDNYTDTTRYNIVNLVNLIRIEPLRVSADLMGDGKTITDADVIKEITSLIADAEQTCEPAERDFRGGGSPFTLKYVYRGTAYRVTPDNDDGKYTLNIDYDYMDKDKKRGNAYEITKEIYDELYSLAENAQESY